MMYFHKYLDPIECDTYLGAQYYYILTLQNYRKRKDSSSSWCYHSTPADTSASYHVAKVSFIAGSSEWLLHLWIQANRLFVWWLPGDA